MKQGRAAPLVAAGLMAMSLLAGCAALAAPAPSERLILGVQTHFAYDRSVNATRVIEWVKAARIDSTRDEMFWNEIEDGKGNFAIRNGAEFTRQAWWNQLPVTSPLLILGYGHPRYDAGGQPSTPSAVSAFAKQAAWLVGQTRLRVRMVEIWNEWNLKAGANAAGGAQGGAADYVRLARATRQSIKAVDPGVLVLVGGIGEDFPDWRWMNEALALGLLDGADGVSVHLYNHCDRANVGADEMLRRLERLQILLTKAAGREMPIFLTEVGWPMHKGACEVSEDNAATFTLRLLLEASQRAWLKGVWFYETIDSGDDANEREQRFGLLRRDGSERPSGCAVREFGAVIAGRPSQVLRHGGVTVAVYQESGRSLVFVWGREGVRGGRVRVRTAALADPPPVASPVPCQWTSGAVTVAASRLELRSQLESARPAVFVLPRLVTLEGVQID